MSYRKLVERIGSGMAVAAVCLMCVLSCSSTGEKDKGVVMKDFVPDRVSGWAVGEATEAYDRETIFDYINGAGEVYRSYGFTGVSVFRYTKPDNPEISVEIFDMGSDEDAYGVFSYARESEETGIGQGYEYRGSLLSFWQGRYYVCILADRETPESKEAVFTLGREVDSRLPQSGKRPALLNCLPDENLKGESVRYLHIYPSLNYHYFLAEDNILKLSPETDAVLAEYPPGPAFLLCVEYPTVAAADDAFCTMVDAYLADADEDGAAEVNEGVWVAARTIDAYVLMALDVPDRERALALLDECEKKLTQTGQ